MRRRGHGGVAVASGGIVGKQKAAPGLTGPGLDHVKGVDATMPEEKQDARQDDEVVDEMPDMGTAPCGDIFETPGATYVTDADPDIAGADRDD